MKRKTSRANNAFLLGSLIMIVLVLVVVVLFLFMSFKMYDKKQDAYNAQRYDIILSSSALGSPITIYMNDSLLFQGTPQSVMTLSVGRFQEESSLLIVDGTTNKVTTIELPNHSETIRLGKREDKFFRE